MLSPRVLSVRRCPDWYLASLTAMHQRSRGKTSTHKLAFAEFVRAHHPSLSRHVAHVYGDQEVDSVVAGVFATAWQRYEEIPQHRAEQWLKSVARHIVFNTRRGDARWASLQRAARETAAAESAPVDDDRRLEVKIVVAALGTLSPDDQRLLRLQGAEEPSPPTNSPPYSESRCGQRGRVCRELANGFTMPASGSSLAGRGFREQDRLVRRLQRVA